MLLKSPSPSCKLPDTPSPRSRARWLKPSLLAAGGALAAGSLMAADRPNILIAITDDQSWLHTSTAGADWIDTPNFERVAGQGVHLERAYVSCPICTPARGAMLTGRHMWQLEEGAVLLAHLPAEYVTLPDILEEAGYEVGFTGKGWGPGANNEGGWTASGPRGRNPAGPAFNSIKTERPTTGMNDVDYAANFEDFYDTRVEEGEPFYFWYGATEPHVPYETGSGLAAGKELTEAVVPPFLPDTETVRGDLLDYALEIERFDADLGKILDKLEAEGELANTIIIVTGDNGMPFARAKGTCYEYGIRVPMAIRWDESIPGDRSVRDLVSQVDIAPTLLEAVGLDVPPAMSGRSILSLLQSEAEGLIDPDREIYAGRERQNHARDDFVGYPIRALRTNEFLYVRNFKPERWPGGKPPLFKDIDPLPSKEELIAGAEDEVIGPFFQMATGKRPAEELYAVETDPGCLNNLAEDPLYADELVRLRERLDERLKLYRDPRAWGYGDIFDSYQWYARADESFEGYQDVNVPNPEFLEKAREALESDADGDGRTLQEELFQGTDPDSADGDSALFRFEPTDSGLRLSWIRDVWVSDFAPNVETSNDLSRWRSVDLPFSSFVPAPSGSRLQEGSMDFFKGSRDLWVRVTLGDG